MGRSLVRQVFIEASCELGSVLGTQRTLLLTWDSDSLLLQWH